MAATPPRQSPGRSGALLAPTRAFGAPERIGPPLACCRLPKGDARHDHRETTPRARVALGYSGAARGNCSAGAVAATPAPPPRLREVVQPSLTSAPSRVLPPVGH